MRRAIVLVLSLACGCGAKSVTDAVGPIDRPGPTALSRTDVGYVLANRHLRVVIEPRTGDVVQWGRVGGPTARVTAGFCGWGGRLGRDGVVASPVADAYGEARDEQTWQFIGTDPALQVRWRKIYVLEGDRVYASFLAQNLRKDESITCGVLLTTDPPNAAHRIQPFNERPDVRPPEGVPGAVAGDVKTLKPGERLDLTTAWRAE